MLTYKHTVCKHDYSFDPTGYKISYEQEEVKEEVTVLQVCIFGSDYMLAEYVFNKDMADKQESENNKE